MKKFRFLLNPLVILFFINLIFFFPLFFPHLKLIITPEYGGGDENIFHYPMKYLFQEKIRQGNFLFWSNKVGGGYPVFAMSELGFLNPINYLTLRFLPLPLAINIQIFLDFLILLYSTYWLGRVFKLSRIISIFYSTVFSYCFFNIANIIHLSHIASFCYVPAIYAITVTFIKKENIKLKYIFLLILALVLQIISGHQQYFYYSLLTICLYLIINFVLYKSKRKQILIKCLLVLFCFIFVILLALPQILPTLEFLKYSNNRLFNNPRSLNFVNLLTFINPFALYPSDLQKLSTDSNSIPPWDSNFYFGLLPLLLSVFLLIKNKLIARKVFFQQNKENIILLVISLLMVFGKNSPIYFIYDLWPFVLFRYPERITFIFLMLVVLILLNIFDRLWEKGNNIVKFLLSLIIVINFISNMYLMYSFHSFIKPNYLFSDNNVINSLKKTKNRILSPFFYDSINSQILHERGTKNEIFQKLILVKNSLTQNFSLLFNISNYNLPTSAINFNRHYYFYYSLFDDNQTASLSASAKSLLSMADIQYLVAPYQLIDKNNDLQLIKKVNEGKFTFYYYQTINYPSRIYFSNKIKKVVTLDEFLQVAKEDNGVIAIEKNIPTLQTSQTKPIFKFQLMKDNDDDVIIQAKSNTDGMMVLADNYYPGWQAYVDGQQVEIIKANLVVRGIFMNSGSHTIEFRYQPEKFYLGLKISLGAVFLLSLILIFYRRLERKLNAI